MATLFSIVCIVGVFASLACAAFPRVPASTAYLWCNIAVGFFVCALADIVYVYAYARRTRVICLLIDPTRATASSTSRIASVYRANRSGTIFDTFVHINVIPPEHTVQQIDETTRIRAMTWQNDIRDALSKVRILISQNHPRTIIAIAGNAPPNLMAYLGYVVGGDPLVAHHAKFVVVDTSACGYVHATLPNFIAIHKLVSPSVQVLSTPTPTPSDRTANIAFFADTHGVLPHALTAAISRALDIQAMVPVVQYTMPPPVDDYDGSAIALLLESRDWMMSPHANAFIAVDASARLAVCVGMFARACRATRLWFVEPHSLTTAICVACDGSPICLERRTRRVSY